MKTYIPEKIKPEDNHLLAACLNVNYLIDVVTEQQKEIEDQEGQIQHLGKRCDGFLRSITDIEQSNNKPEPSEEQPYTAIRSTGEAKCCYFNPDCPICPKIPNEELNDRVDDFPPMKERVREKVASNLQYMFAQVGRTWNMLKEEERTNWFVKADKIIAIVKGE